MQSNKLWETNLTTTKESVKLSIILLETKAYQQNHPQVIILEAQLLNGKSLMLFIRKWKRKETLKIKLRKKRMLIRTKSKKVHCIQIHSKDVWKLWKEWLFKTINRKNTRNIVIIGVKEILISTFKKLKVIYCQFGDFPTKNKEKKVSHPFAGTHNTQTCSQFHWEAMISSNKKWV